jgi:co-chaperonin GroES (HSP10)|tara:strand:- start:314 stop:568 length:255 start_codon:yes stop_codon:yes gene_type:complete
MKAIGNYIIINETEEKVKTTKGGLELTEKHREDIRYIEAVIISSGTEILKSGQGIVYDRVAGYPIEFEDKVYKVIQVRDVVALL